jgi:hypothetical protein
VKTNAPSKQSTGIHRIHLSGNRVVVIDAKDLSKDIIGVCVANSQNPEVLLANLRKIPSVLSARFEIDYPAK